MLQVLPVVQNAVSDSVGEVDRVQRLVFWSLHFPGLFNRIFGHVNVLLSTCTLWKFASARRKRSEYSAQQTNWPHLNSSPSPLTCLVPGQSFQKGQALGRSVRNTLEARKHAILQAMRADPHSSPTLFCFSHGQVGFLGGGKFGRDSGLPTGFWDCVQCYFNSILKNVAVWGFV